MSNAADVPSSPLPRLERPIFSSNSNNTLPSFSAPLAWPLVKKVPTSPRAASACSRPRRALANRFRRLKHSVLCVKRKYEHKNAFWMNARFGGKSYVDFLYDPHSNVGNGETTA